MRPLSLASSDVLLRTCNPPVRGESPAEGTPEFTGALMGFVYTHCAPWPEVVRASFSDQAFREAALIFCGQLTPADFQTAFGRMEEQGRELEAAQAEPVSGRPGKMHCDEPGYLAAQVFAIAAETGWPEERILFMPAGEAGAVPALRAEEEWGEGVVVWRCTSRAGSGAHAERASRVVARRWRLTTIES